MSGEPRHINVLHVEDDPGFSELAANFLEREQERIAVTSAPNAEAGLEALTDDIDCIVSDYDMPGKTGIEFLDQVREEHPDLPFILYTGKGSEEVASRAISAGVTDYLQKESGTDQYAILANRVVNAVQAERDRTAAAKTEQQLQTIAENTTDILWKFTADWDDLLFINSPYEDIWGQSIDDLRNDPQSFFEGIHPEDREAVKEAMGRLSAGESVDIEFRVNPDEDYGRWAWVRGEPVTDAAGEVETVVGFSRDITQRKEREQTLADQRSDLRLFERAIEGSTDLIGAIDSDYNLIFANERHQEFHGYNADDMIGHPVAEIIGDSWESAVKPRVDRALAGEVVKFDMERTGADGEVRSFDLRFYPLPGDDGTIDGVVGTMRDITERKRREQEISRLNELHRTVLSNIRETVLLTDDDGQFTYICPNVEYIFGYDEPAVAEIGTVDELFGERVVDAAELTDADEVTNIETEVCDKDGAEIDVLVTVRGVSIEDGTRLYSVRDISELKERERRLRETSRRLELALTATNTGVWEWDLETDEVRWTETLEELLGMDPGSFGGTYEAFTEHLHSEDVPQIEAAIGDALDGDGRFHAEFRMVRADGEHIWVEGRGQVIEEDGSRLMIGTTTEITERKETEAALAEREALNPQVELTFEADELATLVRDEIGDDMAIELEGLVERDDGYLFYATVEGPTVAEFLDLIDLVPTIESARLLKTTGDTARYEMEITGHSLAAAFESFDGTLTGIRLEDGTCKLVGEFPETVDPDAVTAAGRERYPDLELARRRRVERPTYLRRLVEDELTDRQLTALEMAHHGNYFDQPRESTGDDLAERLGITRQTYNSHLRTAQATLLELLFEGDFEPPT